MRTMLRGKVSLLVMTCAVLLAVPAIALADVLQGDADSDALATPNANSKSANQAPGTTASYDFSAFVDETGNATNDAFKVAGDYVTVDIVRGGDWLNTSDAGSPANFIFTKYTEDDTLTSTPDNSQDGTINVTVPCTATGSKDMTAVLTAVAKNAGADGIIGNADDTTLPSTGSTNRQLNPNTQTFTYTITASGTPAASCTPANSAPVIASDNASRTVDEGQTATNTGTWSDANAGDTVTLSASVGNVTKNDNGTWSWSYGTTDGPANSQTVTITATDNHAASNNTTFGLTVNNVAPTVSSVSASAQNALSGKNVTFTGTATDVSSVDQAAGFFWKWSEDGGTFGSYGAQSANTFTASFSSCGSHHVSAVAKDKDNGESAAVDSGSVNVYNASFAPPVDTAPYVNTVQKGRVIPVKISVGCATNLTGLQPSIQLLSGDKTDGSETTTDEIETYSVSSADSGVVMRTADGGYIYNLRVPDVANAYYTVRVNPFGGSNASSNMYALLKTRK
jgi:hypothetical protein